MGGGYVLCEWDEVAVQNPEFQATFAALENDIIRKTAIDWSPRTFGAMLPSSDQFGRTTILPAAFRGFGMSYSTTPTAGTNFMPHWRQTLTSTGHQTLIMGERNGDIIPEDIKVAWLGLAFPNKQQHITEVRWQIGDRKFGRVNLEQMLAYDTPALIFEDGFVLDEETSFHLYGYIDGPIPVIPWAPDTDSIYQSIVMLGAMYYKNINRVLGNTGAIIT